MHVLTKRPFIEAARKYPNERNALMEMYRVLQRFDFSTPQALKHVFPSLDNFKYMDRWWVLNVGGNHLRVILFIQFVNQRIYIKNIIDHPDYDRLCQKYRKYQSTVNTVQQSKIYKYN